MEYPPEKPKRKPKREDTFEAPPPSFNLLPVIAGVAMLIAALSLWANSFGLCSSLTAEELLVSSTPRSRAVAADFLFVLGFFLAISQFDAIPLTKSSVIGLALLFVILRAGDQSLLLAAIVVMLILVSLRKDKHALIQGIAGILGAAAIGMCAIVNLIVVVDNCETINWLFNDSGIFANF